LKNLIVVLEPSLEQLELFDCMFLIVIGVNLELILCEKKIFFPKD